MTDRLTVDSINSDQLDRLYDDLAIVTARACRDSEDLVAAQAERDGAYRERAHLVALLAAMTGGAVITPALDLDEPGWWIAYLTIGKWQASWHISPRDAGLFKGVERVEPDDPRAQWDGHTTDQKYARIRNHARVLEMNRRLAAGRAQRAATEAAETATDEAVAPEGFDPDDPTTAPCPHCATRPPRNRLDDHITTEHANLPPCTAYVPDGSGGRKTCALRVGHKDGEYGDWHTSKADGPEGRWVWNDGAQGAVPHDASGSPDDPPAQCWHTEAGTPCDWDVCNQPERLAAGDYGIDPRGK